MNRTKIAALACIAGVLTQAAAGAAPSSAIERDVGSILRRPAMRASQLGIAFYDVDSGRMLYQHDAQKYFVAASTTKVLTESTSLALLGPNYRFTTNVYRTGEVDSAGVLHGDIVLRAAGDPDLSGRIQPDGTLAFENEDHAYGSTGIPDAKAVPGDPLAVLRDFAKQIRGRGITSVTGQVLVDDSLFPDDTQELGTGTNVAPISVNDNVVDVTIRAGTKAGDPVSVSVSPVTAYVLFTNTAVTGAAHSANTIAMPTDVADASGNRHVTIAGSFPIDSHPILYAYPVPSARQFAEVAFTQVLVDAGVHVDRQPAAQPVAASAAVYTAANVVATHLSPPLSQDVKITLKVSDNLHAAMMPYLWGALLAHDTADPQAAGFNLENAFLKRAGFDPLDFVQNDGEGANAFFQPEKLVRFLAYVRRQAYFPDLYRGLPILGVDGTLYNIQNGKPAAGKVHAKTGTNGNGDLLNQNRLFITGKGLLGYMTTRRGRHVAFCVYVNNFAIRPNQDVMLAAGQIAGEIASDGYLDL